MLRTYCPDCKRYVNEFDWAILALGLICFVIPGLTYIAYCLLKTPRCPKCGKKLRKGDDPLNYM